MNRVFLTGRLGADPEIKTTGAGKTIANVRMATNRRRKDGDRWVEEADWHKLVAFDREAESFARAARKGTLLTVEGELRYRSYEKDGHKVNLTEIHVQRIEYLSDFGKRDAESGDGTASSKSEPASYSEPKPDADIPF